MEQWQSWLKEAKKGRFSIKEFLTRSEGPELFTTALNDKLLAGANELPAEYGQIFDEVRVTEGRTISFPSIRGANPDLVPELAEYPFVDQELTSITVEVEKFGYRLGISYEMIQDNQVGLMGRQAANVGRAHRELGNREHFKCISFYSTGPTKATGIVGLRNHGVWYPAGGYTNVATGSATTWEERIALAINRLYTQTITVGDMTIPFPVVPNFILAHPTHMMGIRKVLNASNTVYATGVGADGAGGGGDSQLAGSNVFAGLLPIQIFHPTIVAGQAFIGLAKRGLVTVRKSDLETEEMNNFSFDATELKSRERFLPAVIEERFICDLQITGA